MKIINYKSFIGKKFNSLTIISDARPKKRSDGRNRMIVDCRCECGKTLAIPLNEVRSGHSKTCGHNRYLNMKISVTKHNHSYSHLYNSWASLIQRCTNKKCRGFKNYGGRGIKVCEKWLNASEFIEWAINNGYQKGLTIERINNNGNYTPKNCRWATRTEQGRNTRRNKIIEIDGIKKCLSEWCEIYNANYSLVFRRLQRGWDIKQSLTVSSNFQTSIL